jgi:hypothetical protein
MMEQRIHAACSGVEGASKIKRSIPVLKNIPGTHFLRTHVYNEKKQKGDRRV